jgi:hypothetical protein
MYHDLILESKERKLTKNEEDRRLARLVQLSELLHNNDCLPPYIRRLSLHYPICCASDDNEDPRFKIIEMLPSVRVLHLSPPPIHLSLPVAIQVQALHLDFSSFHEQYIPLKVDHDYTTFIAPYRRAEGALFATIANALSLPALRIRAISNNDFMYNQSALEQPPAAPGVSDLFLKIDQIELSFGFPSTVLRSTTKLSRLMILMTRPSPSMSPSMPDMDAKVVHALRSLAGTIEILGIIPNCLSHVKCLSNDYHKFTCLRVLMIEEKVLWNEIHKVIGNCLPRSLEELQLQYTFHILRGLDTRVGRSRKRLENMMEGLDRARLPSLRKVVKWEQQNFIPNIQGEFEEMILKLVAGFYQHGVTFEVSWAADVENTSLGGYVAWEAELGHRS